MTFLSELPQTDLTKFKLDTFFTNNTPEVSGAGLYLISLANTDEYVDDMIKFDGLTISEDIIRVYKQIKNYFDFKLPPNPVATSGTVLTFSTGYTLEQLYEFIQEGHLLLNIVGAEFLPKRAKNVDITTEQSAFLNDYRSNKKVHNISDELIIVMVQEVVGKYDMIDAEVMEVCKLLDFGNLHMSYAVLAQSYLPDIDDILGGYAVPSYEKATLNEGDWMMLLKLESLLDHHIRPRSIISPEG